jgi:SAM-dependent methyltransferase
MTTWRAATPANPRLANDGSYRLLRCSACGSGALGPSPEVPVGDQLYEGGAYAPTRGALRRPLGRLRRLTDRDRMRLMGGVRPGERVLELGAGRGSLLAQIERAGAQAYGIEPSPSAAAAARERGAGVEVRSIEEAEFPPGSRDLVILWHVLEHLERPAAALQRVRPWLSAGGRLVVAIPNLDSLQARIGGDRWFHQDVPRHRTHFTREGLTRLLRRSDYTPVRIRQTIVDQGLLGMWLTLLNRLTAARDVPFRFAKRDLRYERRTHAARDAMITVIAGPLLVPVAVALELGAAVARRGGSIVVEARLQPSGPTENG